MIADEVLELSDGFAASWNEILAPYPKYQLDYTWPSIGTVQMIVHPIQHKGFLDPVDLQVIQGATAYLITFLYGMFSVYADSPKVKVEFIPDEISEYLLTIEGGKYLKQGEKVTLRFVSTILNKVLRPEEPFPYFEKTSIRLEPGLGSIPFFMLGLLTGLSPYYEGPWKGLDDRDLADYVQFAERVLAESCVLYYKRVFPGEPLGQERSFYERRQLIVPPFGHKQEDLLTRPVFWLLAKDMQQNPGLKKCLHNLATSPLQTLSLPAIVALYAVVDESDLPWFKPLGQDTAAILHRIRGAITFARTCVRIPEFPEVAAILAQKDLAALLLTLDSETDIIPWLCIRPAEIVKHAPPEFYFHLSAGNWPLVAEQCLKIAETESDFLIQGGLFYLMAGLTEEAGKAFALSEDKPLSGHIIPFQRLLRSCLAAADFEFGLSTKIIALSFESDDEMEPRARLLLARHYLGVLAFQERSQEANAWLSDNFTIEELDFPTVIDAVQLSVQAGDLGRADALADRAVLLAPNSHHAFRVLVERLLRNYKTSTKRFSPASSENAETTNSTNASRSGSDAEN